MLRQKTHEISIALVLAMRANFFLMAGTVLHFGFNVTVNVEDMLMFLLLLSSADPKSRTFQFPML